MRGFIFFLIT